MLFTSFQFLFIFLPISVGLFFLLAHFRFTKAATVLLITASLAFYSYWDITYLPLLLASIAFNYFVGSKIERNRSKTLLFFGVAVNLALLGYFKYTGFFFSSLNNGLDLGLHVPDIILPLGISFFTFTQTAFLVDAYRGETAKYDILTYSLFVTFFPHLIAGPILYHKDVIPQFFRKRNFIFSQKNFALGITIFILGLCKKVLIADRISPWVWNIFSNSQQVSLVEAWVGALSYTFQLYFDFSGYSDMAIGLGLMLNIRLPINFNSPYKATSIADFWRRWHITLSTFLRNYLYIPLGGNRHGEFNRMRNLLLTMLLGGLWHGAGWTFIIWGTLHGIFLVINHTWRKTGMKLPKPLCWLMTFNAVVLAWVFFRADSVKQALNIVGAMFGLQGIVIPMGFAKYLGFLKSYGVQFGLLPHIKGNVEIIALTALILIVLFVPNVLQFVGYREKETTKAPSAEAKSHGPFTMGRAIALGVVMFFILKLLLINPPSDFLYFQF